MCANESDNQPSTQPYDTPFLTHNYRNIHQSSPFTQHAMKNSLHDDSERGLLVDEDSPLLVRHMSMEQPPSYGHSHTGRYHRHSSLTSSPSPLKSGNPTSPAVLVRRLLVLSATLLLVLGLSAWRRMVLAADHRPLAIHEAKEFFVEVDPGISLWYRTWGNRHSGIPVLFVHGGPGTLCRLNRSA